MILPEEDLLAAEILVVDDNPVNVSLLSEMLLSAGFANVTGVTDPLSGLDMLRAKAFDLVLLDIRMPKIDGHEFMARIPQLTDGLVPVIVLTAQTDAETRLKALGAGARDFLTKPFDMVEAVHRIRNTLETQILYTRRRTQADDLERVVAERTSALVRLANYDSVTGLPNRSGLRNIIGERTAGEGSGSLLLVAVDGLESVNDGLGHQVGEDVLRVVGAELQSRLPTGTVVGSWSTSEFVVFGTGQASDLAVEIGALFAAPIASGDHELVLSCRIGGCRYPEDGHDADRLVQRAGLAMLHGTRIRVPFATFSIELEAAASRRLTIERELRRAVDRGQLSVFYQPKLSLVDRSVLGMEALLRWIHPELGFVSPGVFVPIAEETGAIVGIGEWVLQAACEDAARWQAEGLGDLKLAVNVSGRQFEGDDLAAIVRRTLDSTGIAPNLLEVEITESALMRDVGRTRNILGAIRNFGVSIAVDDFGTGYSSLAYLRRFPLDTIKIDQSFVRDLTDDPDDQAIVRTIIAMAHSLGLRTIAEGIETEAHAAFIRRMGGLEGQGYLFARPMPGDEFAEYVRRNRETIASMPAARG